MRVNVYAEDLHGMSVGTPAKGEFNGIALYVDSGTSPKNAVTFWMRRGSQRDRDQLKAALQRALEFIGELEAAAESHHVPD